jgi:sugar lactone lactonase YvrE
VKAEWHSLVCAADDPAGLPLTGAFAARIVGCQVAGQMTCPVVHGKTHPAKDNTVSPKILALVASACAASAMAPAALAADAASDRITFKAPGSLPEGIEYDTKNKRFLVGSLSEGTVYEISRDGTRKPFIQDPDLKSSVGIEVDEERNRLLVANSDAAVFRGQSAGQAKLGIYDLSSGKRIAMVDLAAAGPKEAKSHFANDVTVGKDGSAYVTNTMARVVYKVDPKNAVSVVLPNNFGAGQLMLNGIVFHPSGYLIVAESGAGDLYKVPLTGGTYTKVKLPEAVTGADGIVWHSDGRLLVVRNDASKSVVALKSGDEWASATVEGRGTFGTQGTTAAVSADGVYVVQPFFADPKADPIIEKVQLK